MQDHNLKDLATLFAPVEGLKMREDIDANMDEIVVMGAKFKQPDGTEKVELAVGSLCEDFYHGFVPIVDVLKFALVNCEELVAQALRETGRTGDIRRIADDVDLAFDMESGQ